MPAVPEHAAGPHTAVGATRYFRHGPVAQMTDLTPSEGIASLCALAFHSCLTSLLLLLLLGQNARAARLRASRGGGPTTESLDHESIRTMRTSGSARLLWQRLCSRQRDWCSDDWSRLRSHEGWKSGPRAGGWYRAQLQQQRLHLGTRREELVRLLLAHRRGWSDRRRRRWRRPLAQ